ncbi:MAG: pyrroline-5-carboxylate reductase [Myxococcota bacterium]
MAHLDQKRLAVVGCGNLGRALVAGLIESGAMSPDRIAVSNRRSERSRAMAERFQVRAADDNVDCVSGADVVLVAVKPQIVPGVLEELAGPAQDALVISVAAGVSSGRIESELERNPRVVRAMPNTPAVIKQSATALAPGAHATEEDLNLARSIFEAVGRVVVVDENHLDAVTGLSGSGPAYVFLMIEAFADAGVKVGLSREVALELAVQTIQGSARLLQETQEHPGRLKDQVTSPGGCAIAGLHTLEEGGLRTTLMNAVEAATRRASELGKD